MKKIMAVTTVAVILAASMVTTGYATEEIGSVSLSRISTPDTVETAIGTLKFIDGAPLTDTAERVYDYLDTMRAVDVFLKGIPPASIQGMMEGPRVLGQKTSNQILIFDKLADANSQYLTTNTSTMYVFGKLDLKVDGPTVVDVPPGMLGAFQDAWFRYAADIGPFGQDKGKGGKYLVLPPGYEGDVPKGYFIIKSRTYKMMAFMRGSIAKGLDVAEANARKTRIYPLAKKDNPPKMEFISGSGKKFNTVHTNDHTFYEHVNEVIQYEPLDMIDPETRGLFASIGIEKGKPFAPDDRMKKILVNGVAIANAIARSIVWYPRIEGSVDNMKGIELYPGDNSAWLMGWVDKNVFFNGKDKHTMNSDARVMFHYPYTIVTPAMAVTIPGKGSDYGIAYLDANKQPFDGSKTYRLHLPANPPANDFWAMTLYDTQTRAPFPSMGGKATVGSQTGVKPNKDGSYDIYYAPRPPKGYETNWLETIPGKSWFTVIRMYGPEEKWINKTWRPSEIELVR
jgi:hypothetical protein